MFNKYFLYYFFISILTISGAIMSDNDWTRNYTKLFSDNEVQHNKNKKQIIFEKQKTPLFSQLIFSWNAFRPKKGHFSFFVQSRNAKTKQWGKWHLMFDWGQNIQKSHFSNFQGDDKYMYVRLEVDKKQLADSFRIKILANNDAHLDKVKRFSVSVSNFNEFKHENSFVMNNFSSVHVKKVPKKSQLILKHERACHMCSPTASSIVVDYFSKERHNPLSFAKNSLDHGLNIYGSWPFNVAHAFECCKGKVFFSVVRLNSFIDIYRQLKKDIPVVVSVRGSLPGALKEYNNF